MAVIVTSLLIYNIFLKFFVWMYMLFKQATYYRDLQQTNMSSMSNLFAVAVGIKQKDLVNRMVKKVLNWTLDVNYCNFYFFILWLIALYTPPCCSFYQAILLWCFSIMMVFLMNGRILNGVIMSFTFLQSTKLNGKLI